MFVLAACSTLLAFVVRIPVCVVFPIGGLLPFLLITNSQMPDKDLDDHKKTVGEAS